jgi:flagellar biosynthetic protein FliR
MNVTISDQTLFLAYWLSFSRWSAVILQLPLFDNVAIPNILKVLTSFLVAYAFFPNLSGTLVAEIN